MSRSDRDPLFFPPQKYPEEPEQEGYSVDVDTASQEKRLKAIVIIAIGALVVVLAVLKSDTLRSLWSETTGAIGKLASRTPAAPAADAPLDSLPPQTQAQRLLQRAAQRQPGALEELNKRLPTWHGKLRLDDALWSALGTAFDASDIAVRAAAVDVDMEARGIERKPETVDRMISAAEPGQSNRPAALWALGELAYAQVQPLTARQAINTYLHDPQADIRYWAVSSLAMTGQGDVIVALIDILRNDPSLRVRENAARCIAAGGMFTRDERDAAVPELVRMAEDLTLDGGTRTFVFHALRDITGQNLPDDGRAWRKWAEENHVGWRFTY